MDCHKAFQRQWAKHSENNEYLDWCLAQSIPDEEDDKDPGACNDAAAFAFCCCNCIRVKKRQSSGLWFVILQ